MPSPNSELPILQDIQDATPSWSGYNHQGKVALYLVLRTLNERHEQGLSITNYAVEIESLEDISILDGQDYLSLHQVKSYKSQALSAYKDAIWILLNKSDKYTPTEGVYLHTVKPISTPTMEQVMGLNASENVQDIRERVLATLNATFPTFQLYPYSADNRHCSLQAIDQELDAQIHTYLTTHSLDYYDVSKKRLKLLNVIHNHVMERHAARHAIKDVVSTPDSLDDTSPVLPFAVFEQYLLANDDEPNDFYLLCKLKEWFTYVCDDYVSELQEEGIIELENLVQAAALISSLSYSDFQTFCRKVNPHVNWTSLDLTTFKELFEKTPTRESLLLVLQKVAKELHQEHFTYESNDKFYLPTTIHGGPYNPYYEHIRKRIARDILSNSALDEILMEVQIFISSHMEMTTLQEAAGHIDDIDLDLDGRNRVTRLGPISMITVTQALKEIE